MNHPDANELLMTARQLLMDGIFPALPKEYHYEVRMIASAMGIAAREAHDGGRVDDQERTLLLALKKHQDSGHTLPALRASVAREIRNGLFDKSSVLRENLEKALLEITLNALSISNPKAISVRSER